jgi:hypothetical protein
MELGVTHEAEQAIMELPFVSEPQPGHIAFWRIDGVGHDPTDIELGEMYAALAIGVARKFDLPILIGVILRDMVLSGRITGIEAGFLAAVSSAARAGSMN